MNVLYDYQIFLFQKYGGVSRYIYEISRRIKMLEGFDANILSPIYRNQYLLEGETKDLILGFYLDLPKVYRWGEPINRCIFQTFARHCKADILHKTTFSPYAPLPNLKTVVTVHDMIPELFSDFFDDPSKEVQVHQKAKSVLQAEHVICVSENTKKDLVNILNVDPSKISVIHHGFSWRPVLPISPSLIPDRPYILYVGTRGGYKNFSSLLRAFGSTKSIRKNFLLICFGGGKLSKCEFDFMYEIGLSEANVKQVSGNDNYLSHLFLNASLFIYPSLYEGFGLPLLEAMGLNCPIACSNSSSMPEVAGDAADYFDPHAFESISSSMESILLSSEKSSKLVESGKSRIKLFSWEKATEKTSEVYASIL